MSVSGSANRSDDVRLQIRPKGEGQPPGTAKELEGNHLEMGASPDKVKGQPPLLLASANEGAFVGHPQTHVQIIARFLGLPAAARLRTVTPFFQTSINSDLKLKASLASLASAYGLIAHHPVEVQENEAAIAEHRRREDMCREVHGKIKLPAYVLAGTTTLGFVASAISSFAFLVHKGIDASVAASTSYASPEYAASKQAEFEHAEAMYKSLYALEGFGAGLVLSLVVCSVRCFSDRAANAASTRRHMLDRGPKLAKGLQQAKHAAAELVFHLGAGGDPENKVVSQFDLGKGAYRTVSAGVHELLAAPESMLPLDVKIEFLKFWPKCIWKSGKSLTAFLKAVIDSPVLNANQKYEICFGVAYIKGEDEDVVVASRIAALQASTSVDVANLRQRWQPEPASS